MVRVEPTLLAMSGPTMSLVRLSFMCCPCGGAGFDPDGPSEWPPPPVAFTHTSPTSADKEDGSGFCFFSLEKNPEPRALAKSLQKGV